MNQRLATGLERPLDHFSFRSPYVKFKTDLKHLVRSESKISYKAFCLIYKVINPDKGRLTNISRTCWVTVLFQIFCLKFKLIICIIIFPNKITRPLCTLTCFSFHPATRVYIKLAPNLCGIILKCDFLLFSFKLSCCFVVETDCLFTLPNPLLQISALYSTVDKPVLEEEKEHDYSSISEIRGMVVESSSSELYATVRDVYPSPPAEQSPENAEHGYETIKITKSAEDESQHDDGLMESDYANVGELELNSEMSRL